MVERCTSVMLVFAALFNSDVTTAQEAEASPEIVQSQEADLSVVWRFDSGG